MHKRQVVHDLPSYTNHHDCATSPRSVCRGDYAALNTCAFKHDFRCAVFPDVFEVEQPPDLFRVALRIHVSVYLVCEGGRDELLRKSQPFGLYVCDDDGVCAACSRSRESDETDGSSAADDSTATK